MTLRRRVRRVLEPVPGAVPAARLAVEAGGIAMRYRVTGLAAEAAFFMLLSLPPLLLGLIAGVGYLGESLSPDAVTNVSRAIETWSLRFLTPEVVQDIIVPTVRDTLAGGRAELISLGFLLSLWSGSRALHVFLDTIAIMYGQSGARGIVGSRVLSQSLYVATLLIGSVIFPLVLLGPSLLSDWLHAELDFIIGAYWPTVGLVGLLSLTGLYHVATPQRSPFVRDLPGAVLVVVIWVAASMLVRRFAGEAIGGPSIYGPLATPIIVLIWFYLLAIAVLLGAALNAAMRRLWPPPEYRGPVVRAADWWEQVRTPADRRRTLTPVERGEDGKG